MSAFFTPHQAMLDRVLGGIQAITAILVTATQETLAEDLSDAGAILDDLQDDIVAALSGDTPTCVAELVDDATLSAAGAMLEVP